MISEERLGPNIWPEVADQAKGTKDIMRRVWAIEAYCQQKVSETNSIALFSSGKKAKYMSELIFDSMTIMLLI